MTFFVKHGAMTDLLSEPTAASHSKQHLFPNRELGDPIRTSDGFLFFVVGGPADETLKGWVSKEDCEDRTDEADRPPLREAGFVQECVNVQLLFNSTEQIKPADGAKPAELMQPWGVSCDFLIARALFETGIKS